MVNNGYIYMILTPYWCKRTTRCDYCCPNPRPIPYGSRPILPGDPAFLVLLKGPKKVVNRHYHILCWQKEQMSYLLKAGRPNEPYR